MRLLVAPLGPIIRLHSLVNGITLPQALQSSPRKLLLDTTSFLSCTPFSSFESLTACSKPCRPYHPTLLGIQDAQLRVTDDIRATGRTAAGRNFRFRLQIVCQRPTKTLELQTR